MSSPDLNEWSIPVAFHFGVKVDGTMTSVSEVSGIECSLETNPVKSGGDNSQCYYVPTKRTFSDLELKRGFCKKGDAFFEWCKSILTVELSEKCINLKNIDVMLLDEEGAPLTTWHLKHAYPIKWTVGKFESMKNELAVETVTLKYSSFEIEQS